MLVMMINDSALSVYRDGDIAYEEPGMAIVTNDEICFGKSALKKARLDPTHTHSQYWQQLCKQPVVPGGPGVKNQADLVYRQLAEIKSTVSIDKDEPIIVLVSGNTTQNQLSLFLGIAQAVELNIRAFVDVAIAAGSTLSLPNTSFFLDLNWHRGLLTDITQEQQTVGGNVSEIHTIGLNYLIESWVSTIADQFVAETRFDPLRIADTEQQVFEQVLNAYETSVYELTITIEYDGSTRQVDVDNEVLATKILPRFEQITQSFASSTTLIIPTRIAHIPGLIDHLKNNGHEVIPVDLNFLTSYINNLGADHFQDDSVQFLRSLFKNDVIEPCSADKIHQPTHLLLDHVATPLNKLLDARDDPNYKQFKETCDIVQETNRCALIPLIREKISVNGERITKTTNVSTGDIIELDGLNYQLIHVSTDV